jgi:hypothetical protein
MTISFLVLAAVAGSASRALLFAIRWTGRHA